nr:hypothetical protein BaRGS_024037 [Batillaria attramentaria]
MDTGKKGQKEPKKAKPADIKLDRPTSKERDGGVVTAIHECIITRVNEAFDQSGDDARSAEEKDLETEVLKIFQESGANVKPDDVSVMHRTGKKRLGGRPVLVRFVSRQKKAEVMMCKRALRDKVDYKVYINEDLKRHAGIGKAYHQGFMTEESRHLTAFVTPWGLYEWARISFGLTRAPAAYRRFMEETLREVQDRCWVPYMDDSLVYSAVLHHKQDNGQLAVIGLVAEFQKKINAAWRNTAALVAPVFPHQCFPVRESAENKVLFEVHATSPAEPVYL